MSNLKVNFPEISQVAVVVRDMKKTIENYWKILGLGPWSIYTFAPPALKEMRVRGKSVTYSMKLAETTVGGVIIEVLEPLEGPSIYKEFLEQKGGGPHHIACYKVPDVKEALENFKKMGIAVLQSGKFDEVEFYYLDTENTLGTVTEIVTDGKIRPPDAYYPSKKK
jgi:Glyoxalase/Bleomycin resistance protein/Dioxygenase superfamily